MGIYQQAMTIGQAKSTEQIWQKIEELEDLERQYGDHRPDGQGFEDMFKRFMIHNILPTNVSQHITLEGRDNEQDQKYEVIRKRSDFLFTNCSRRSCSNVE